MIILIKTRINLFIKFFSNTFSQQRFQTWIQIKSLSCLQFLQFLSLWEIEKKIQYFNALMKVFYYE